MIISQRIDRAGRALALALDGDWEQEEVDQALPDCLQYGPDAMNKAQRIGPDSLTLRLGDRERRYRVTAFTVEDCPAERVVIRHYVLGDAV